MMMSFIHWYVLSALFALVGYLVFFIKDELYFLYVKYKTHGEVLDAIHCVDREIHRGSLCVICVKGRVYLKNKQALSYLYRRLYDIDDEIKWIWELLYYKLHSRLFGRALVFLCQVVKCSRWAWSEDGGYMGDTDTDVPDAKVRKKKIRKTKKNCFAGTGKKRRRRQSRCKQEQVVRQVIRENAISPSMCIDRSAIIRTMPAVVKKKAKISMRTLRAKEAYLIAKDKQMVCKRCQNKRPCSKSHVKQIEEYLKLSKNKNKLVV